MRTSTGTAGTHLAGRARLRRVLVPALALALLLPAACSDGAPQQAVRPRAGTSTGASLSSSAPAAGGPTATDGTAGSCSIPSRFAGEEVDRLPLRRRLVALTFDAGGDADGVPSIRATLHRTGVPATFFLTGAFASRYPVRASRMAARDLVGNHTMTHADLTALSDAEVRTEVLDAEEVVRATTGQDPRRFLRFPFGARDPRTIGLVDRLCYVPFGWTVDTLGWQGTSGGRSVASVVARVVGAAEPGAIVLMHVGSNPDDGTTLDADALPRVIRRLRALGYGFVRLSRVMSAAP